MCFQLWKRLKIFIIILVVIYRVHTAFTFEYYFLWMVIIAVFIIILLLNKMKITEIMVLKQRIVRGLCFRIVFLVKDTKFKFCTVSAFYKLLYIPYILEEIQFFMTKLIKLRCFELRLSFLHSSNVNALHDEKQFNCDCIHWMNWISPVFEKKSNFLTISQQNML